MITRQITTKVTNDLSELKWKLCNTGRSRFSCLVLKSRRENRENKINCHQTKRSLANELSIFYKSNEIIARDLNNS